MPKYFFLQTYSDDLIVFFVVLVPRPAGSILSNTLSAKTPCLSVCSTFVSISSTLAAELEEALQLGAELEAQLAHSNRELQVKILTIYVVSVLFGFYIHSTIFDAQ